MADGQASHSEGEHQADSAGHKEIANNGWRINPIVGLSGHRLFSTEGMSAADGRNRSMAMTRF
jgi:hypothetical protein